MSIEASEVELVSKFLRELADSNVPQNVSTLVPGQFLNEIRFKCGIAAATPESEQLVALLVEDFVAKMVAACEEQARVRSHSSGCECVVTAQDVFEFIELSRGLTSPL